MEFRWKWIALKDPVCGEDTCGRFFTSEKIKVIKTSTIWFIREGDCIRSALENVPTKFPQNLQCDSEVVPASNQYLVVEQRNKVIMNFKERLDTFHKWPKALAQRPAELSRAGFFYTGVGDVVKCPFCNIKLSNWMSDDKAWNEHKKFSEHCDFIKR